MLLKFQPMASGLPCLSKMAEQKISVHSGENLILYFKEKMFLYMATPRASLSSKETQELGCLVGSILYRISE